MTHTTNMPENLIPDSANYFEKNGVNIRKGTMAAAVTNIEIIESANSSLLEKHEAIENLKLLAPQLNISGINKHFISRNPKIQAIFDKASDEV